MTAEIQISTQAHAILDQVRRAVVGKDPVLKWALATILSGGHILLEDIPGVGKTTMAVAFSKVLGLDYSRVQFNPDVLPSDITGFTVLDPKTGEMSYKKGAVLCNLFLADELNRATSRTQSALLEAMEEKQVTVDGVSYKLPEPFIVIATQNPTGAAGTQLLPDSQMDRFSLRLSLGYPAPEDEVEMVLGRLKKNPMHSLKNVLTAENLAAMQQTVADTHMHRSIISYIVNLIDATRNHPHILRGASPRATLCLVSMSKAVAQLSGRDYVIPQDVVQSFLKCIPHRLQLSAKAEGGNITADQILFDILAQVKAPQVQ